MSDQNNTSHEEDNTVIDMDHLEISYDRVKFKKMTIVEAKNYLLEYLKKLNKAETIIKAELIREYAEKYKKSGFPLKEIKEKITEDLQNLVSERYISMCLSDEYKSASAIARKKGKQVAQMQGSGASTVMEEPGQEIEDDDNDKKREQLPDIQPSLESDQEQQQTTTEPEKEISVEYVHSLEQQVKALRGEIAYKDMLAHEKIVKLDKQVLLKLDTASKSSNKDVYLIIDTRTREVRDVFSDKEYKKKFK